MEIMKNKEIAEMLMQQPDNQFVVSVDPQFKDEVTRIFADRVIEIVHHEKETVMSMDGRIN